MSDLTKDITVVLAPVMALAQRLSAVERFAIEQACGDVIRICEDEEQDNEKLCDSMQELEQRLEDCGCGDDGIGGRF